MIWSIAVGSLRSYVGGPLARRKDIVERNDQKELILSGRLVALHDWVLISGLPVPIPLEECWYRQGAQEVGNRQFVVADPDGYLLRLFSSLGTRPVKFGSLTEMRAAFADLSDEALRALVDGAVASIRKESSSVARSCRTWRHCDEGMDPDLQDAAAPASTAGDDRV